MASQAKSVCQGVSSSNSYGGVVSKSIVTAHLSLFFHKYIPIVNAKYVLNIEGLGKYFGNPPPTASGSEEKYCLNTLLCFFVVYEVRIITFFSFFRRIQISFKIPLKHRKEKYK